MSEFVPINTQEEFDKAIAARLNRQKQADAAAYEGWVNPEDHANALKALQDQLDAHAGTDQQLKAQITQLQAENGQLNLTILKSKVVDELGLDRKWLSRVTGTNEQEIRDDVESLKELLPRTPAPMATPEPVQSATADADRNLKKMLRELNLNGG